MMYSCSNYELKSHDFLLKI
uniref:Uncharacterized protein n=1 Tax=Anguilla anguilla TaxID=7936 RepID=A0A0E9TM60_ANGAN